MTIAVIGATPANLAAIAGAAAGIKIRVGSVAARASWVIVATAAQRQEAMTSCRLPAFRVVQVPGLDRDGAVEEAVLAQGVARMREVGPFSGEPAAAAVTITGWLMPWIRPALERLLGEGAASVEDRLSKKAATNARDAAAEAEKAERRAARERAGLVEPVTPEQLRQRAERKAQRKATRRATKLLISSGAAKRPGR